MADILGFTRPPTPHEAYRAAMRKFGQTLASATDAQLDAMIPAMERGMTDLDLPIEELPNAISTLTQKIMSSS